MAPIKKLVRNNSVTSIMIVVVFSLVAGYAGVQISGASRANSDIGVPGVELERLLVRYKTGIDSQALTERFSELDAEETDDIKDVRVKVITVPKVAKAALVQALSLDSRVEFVEPEAASSLDMTTPNDPEYPVQWAWPKTKTDVLWDKTKGSSDVVVAVIDSGINYNHPEYAGKTVPGYDFVNNDNDPAEDANHGSAVSGVVAALTNNGVGIASGCWNCKIMPIKIVKSDGTILGANIIKAMEYAANNGAKIISMSISGTGTSSAEEAAVDYAVSKGAIVITSAGNTSANEARRPARYPNVVSVAATIPDDSLRPTSTFGPHVDIAAPGEVRTTAGSGAGYVTITGTSFSTPMVASVIGLLKSAFPAATRTELIAAVTQNVDPCCDSKIGGGRLNAEKAYNFLLAKYPGTTPTPPTTPPTPPTTPPTPPTTPPTNPPQPPPSGADLNGDGKVNITDLSILLSVWGTADPRADLNKNGKVDIADLSILLSGWS